MNNRSVYKRENKTWALVQRVRSEVVLPDENMSQPSEIAKMYAGINGSFVAYFLPDKRHKC